MINQEELAICRRRGHVVYIGTDGWSQCTACGLWLREKRLIEEREDEPLEAELSDATRSRRALAATEKRLKRLEQRTKAKRGKK